MKYEFCVRQEIATTVVIEADSLLEAHDKMDDLIYGGGVTFTEEDIANAQGEIYAEFVEEVSI